MDALQQPATISSMVVLRQSSAILPGVETAQKEGHTDFCWPAAGLIKPSFLKPCKTITAEKYVQ